VKKTSRGVWFAVTHGLLAGFSSRQRPSRARGYGSVVAWYWIGVSAGLGAAVGVFLAGFAGGGRGSRIALILLAGAAGAGIGLAIGNWQSGGWGDRAAGIAGGLAGALGATQTVSGALRRGGTRVGTAALLAGAAIVVAALAWIPAAGYVIAVALVVLVPLLRRARPERYAGLRTLARDD
jgi:asparagine N-glycosylation enzyme membrane subunit Stt3